MGYERNLNLENVQPLERPTHKKSKESKSINPLFLMSSTTQGVVNGSREAENSDADLTSDILK